MSISRVAFLGDNLVFDFVVVQNLFWNVGHLVDS